MWVNLQVSNAGEPNEFSLSQRRTARRSTKPSASSYYRAARDRRTRRPSGVAAKRHAIRQSTLVSLFHDNPELHPYGVETKLGIGCGSPVGRLEKLDEIRA